MSFIEELPKDPNAAFQSTLLKLQEASQSFSTQALTPKARTRALMYVRALQVIRLRIDRSEDYEELLGEILQLVIGSNPHNAKPLLESLQQLYLVNSLENHFIDEMDEKLFNQMDWQDKDRKSVLACLVDARKIVSDSIDFNDNQKRRVLYWLGKAENEAFLPMGKFATFVAATSEVLDLVEKAGEKGSKLATVIQKIRTTTRRNVAVGQIEEAKKPKQISPPKDEG